MESPLDYDLNPLHSRICGLECGSVNFEEPTNSSKNQVTSVLVTPMASIFDSANAIHPSEQDTLTSVIEVNATSIDDQPALIPTSQWNAPDESEGQADARVSNNPGSADSLILRPALAIQHGHKSPPDTQISPPSPKITQHPTSPDCVLYGRPILAIVNSSLAPSGFRGLGRFKTDMSQSVSD
jgi:hypothetical protein